MKTIIQSYKRKDLEYFQGMLNDPYTKDGLATVFTEDQIEEIKNYKYIPWWKKPCDFIIDHRKIFLICISIFCACVLIINIAKSIQIDSNKDSYFQQQLKQAERNLD
jgi:hypothetical protein